MYVIVSKCNTDDCEYLITPKYLGYNGGITKEKLTILARGKKMRI